MDCIKTICEILTAVLTSVGVVYALYNQIIDNRKKYISIKISRYEYTYNKYDDFFHLVKEIDKSQISIQDKELFIEELFNKSLKENKCYLLEDKIHLCEFHDYDNFKKIAQKYNLLKKYFN